MTLSGNGQPFLVLVDDDSHSARLLIRMLLAHGAPTVSWIEDGETAANSLGEVLARRGAMLPDMVIVDLKGSSGQTAEFVARLRSMPGGDGLLVAAMAPSLERISREDLLLAGADAVFQRHGEINSYRGEAASMVSFWARNRRLDAVGT